MATERRLPVLPLPGLSPDSLGSYLASLGLLRVLSRKWPGTRIAWRNEALQVVGGPPTLDALLDELVKVAGERSWTPYDRRWSDEQKKGTKAKSGAPLALWQARAEERELEIFLAHAVPHARVSFNPLLGSGGNAGKRAFSEGWSHSVDALEPPVPTPKRPRENETAKQAGARRRQDQKIVEEHQQERPERSERNRRELENLLLGRPMSWMVEKLNAASWFSESNKLYNSGQAPFREGQLSPWAMVFACEGLAAFAGGASRRLGARSRATGAFPFVTRPAASEIAGEVDRVLGEIWAPLWNRPMTLIEVRTLFARGRAELLGRGALTPAAFATAIRKRGVDAGVSEFRRFILGRTTSANTFEPRFGACFALDADLGGTSAATAITLERVTALIEQRGFPRDRKVGQRWRFEGVRGAIEVGLLNVAAKPNDSEAAIALLDAITAALDRIDRNRSFREGKVRWEPLPIGWLPLLFADEPPGTEARLALSVASGFPEAMPFTAYRFGVEWTRDREYSWTTKPTWFEHSIAAPARWVWGAGGLARVLEAVLSRRLLTEAELGATKMVRHLGRASLPATTSHVRQWLAGDLDEVLLQAWLSRLALFDWRTVPREVRSLIESDSVREVDGELALLGLVQPLVDERRLIIQSLSPDDLLSEETGARTTESGRSLVTLVSSGNLDSAVRLAGSRYAMAGARLPSFDVPWSVGDPERLVAALLFTISDRDRAVLFERWLRPRRRQPGGEAHV